MLCYVMLCYVIRYGLYSVGTCAASAAAFVAHYYFVFLEVFLRDTADTGTLVILLLLLYTVQTTQLLVSLLFPFCNQSAIDIFLFEEELIERPLDLFFFVEELIEVPRLFVMQFNDI